MEVNKMVQVSTLGATPFTPALNPQKVATTPRYMGLSSTVDAAFRAYNDVANVAEYLQRPAYQPDPNFNLADAGAHNPNFLDHLSSFARAKSQAEFDAIDQNIKRNQSDQRTLAAAGFWTGGAAALAAGALSPTMFIPVAGELNGVKGIAQAFALSGVAATAYESALWLNQDNMTAADFRGGITGQTILGGLLGSAAVLLRPKVAARIANEINTAAYGHQLPVLKPGDLKAGETVRVYDKNGEVVSGTFVRNSKDGIVIKFPLGHEVTVGAKDSGLVAPKAVSEPMYDVVPAGTSLDNALAKDNSLGAKSTKEGGYIRFKNFDAAMTAAARITGPFGQLLTAMRKDLRRTVIDAAGKEVPNTNFGKAVPLSETARRLTIQLGNSGMGLDHGPGSDALVPGGSVMANVKRYFAHIPPLVTVLDRTYAEHVLGTGKQVGKVHAAKLKSALKQLPEGKMTKPQFDAEVTRVIHEGPAGALPEVVKAAEAVHKFYANYPKAAERAYQYRVGIDGAAATRPFKLWEGGKYKEGFAHRVYLPSEVAREGFIQLLEKTYNEAMQGMFAATLERHTKEVKAFEKQLAEKGIKGTKAFKKYLGDLTKEQRASARKLDKLIADGADPRDTTGLRDRLTTLGNEIKWARSAAGGKEFGVSNALQLRNDLYDALDEWTGLKIERKGGTGINIQNGVADFAEVAKDMARHTAHKIRGDELRAVNINMMTGEKGPMLARVLDIPYKDIAPYIMKNPEQVARIYNQHMAADIELYRMFGNVNMAPQLKELQHEFDNLVERASKAGARTPTKREKLNRIKAGEPVNAPLPSSTIDNASETAPLQAEIKKTMDNLQMLVNRLRHQRYIPQNTNGFLFRMGTTVRDLNVAAHMGMVLPSSISDIGRPLMKWGLTHTFNDGWVPFIAQNAEYKWAKDQAHFQGIGIDALVSARANAIADMGEPRSTNLSGPEKAIEFLATRIGAVALFNQWTAHMKYISFMVAANEVSRGIRLLQDGGTSAEHLRYRDMFFDAGLSPDLQRRIWAQMNLPGGGVRFRENIMPNTHVWKDLDAADAYAAAMQKLVEMDNIVTPDIGLPGWMDKNLGFKMLGQFRSFEFDSMAKVLLSGVQDFKSGGQRRMAVTQGTMFMLALGALSYYTSAAASGGQAWERAKTATPGDIADEAINRSGLLGWLAEVPRIGQQLPGAQNYVQFGTRWDSRGTPTGLMGALAGPSWDTAKRFSKLVQDMNNPTQSTIHTLRTVMPYQNVWYLRGGLNGAEAVAASFFPAQRKRAKK